MDVAYGGMHYALAEAARFGFAIAPEEARDICPMGEKIREAAREQLPVVHPENPEIRGVTITEFTGPLRKRGSDVHAEARPLGRPGRGADEPSSAAPSQAHPGDHTHGADGFASRRGREKVACEAGRSAIL